MFASFFFSEPLCVCVSYFIFGDEGERDGGVNGGAVLGRGNEA